MMNDGKFSLKSIHISLLAILAFMFLLAGCGGGGGSTTTTTTTSGNSLTIVTASLPSAPANSAFNASLSASGGMPPYAWSVASGSLPAGLTLSGSGAISGTPTTPGNYSFMTQVKDASSQSASKSISMIVTASAPAPL